MACSWICMIIDTHFFFLQEILVPFTLVFAKCCRSISVYPLFWWYYWYVVSLFGTWHFLFFAASTLVSNTRRRISFFLKKNSRFFPSFSSFLYKSCLTALPICLSLSRDWSEWSWSVYIEMPFLLFFLSTGLGFTFCDSFISFLHNIYVLYFLLFSLLSRFIIISALVGN